MKIYCLQTLTILGASFLIQCKNIDSNTNTPPHNTDLEVALTADMLVEEIVEPAKLTGTCETLKDEYARLITTIVKNKSDKQLIGELIDWTKKPQHLRCLEGDLAYNQLVEKLNEQL